MNLTEFERLGVMVIASSSETESEANNTATKLSLSYPVGYAMDPKEFAGQCGAFYSDDGTYLHATGFLLRPNGAVEIGVYSSGSIGRFTASDALKAIKYRINPVD